MIAGALRSAEATAVSSSVLLPNALNSSGWRWQTVIGTACLVVTTLLVLVILMPCHGWRFTHQVSVLLSNYVDGDAEHERTINGMHRWLAVQNDANYRLNEDKIRRLFYCFDLASGSVVLSVILLAVAI